jgi:ATP-dependent Clp protease ATP-binding subunit ClpA
LHKAGFLELQASDTYAKATLTLGYDRRVDLSQTLIFLTSNPGGADRSAI